ncbi:MAG TPA: hypothetical protein VML75_26600 [Kofleriaceae bacterium]|nr:hypothetical protein [Kofleriaceae bacterium]
MVRTSLFTLVFALSLAVSGCGDDGGGTTIDAATTADAPVTPPTADANPNELCEQLCQCASTVCSQSSSACLTECAQIPASVRACRNTHCGYAQSNPTVHCPHVAGDPLDSTTPPECVFDLGIDAGPTDDAMPPDAN